MGAAPKVRAILPTKTQGKVQDNMYLENPPGQVPNPFVPGSEIESTEP